MTKPDYKALCAELTTTLELTWDIKPKVIQELIDRARAALEAQPEPVAPTDDEAIEEAAKLIHASMRLAVPDNHCTRDWVEPYNSLMQDEARRTARAVLARYGTPANQPEPVAAKLAWSKEREPCDECRYNHCIAETPFGRILISWKGWKGCPQITPDEVPWDDPWFPVWSDLEQAKAECEAEYNRRIAVSTNNTREEN
jgi:hypothetical protein